jgi:hypothetical protein
VRHAIDTDRYPLSPRLDRLKAILAKLVPPAGTTTAIASDHGTQPRGAGGGDDEPLQARQ